MDILFEFILEFVLEGSIEISSNKKISKWIRYPLLLFIGFFFISVIALLFFLSFLLFPKNKIISIFMGLFGLFLFFCLLFKFKNLYCKKK